MSLQSSFLLGASLLIGGIGCGKETPAVAEAPETADVQIVQMQTGDFEVYESCLDRVGAQIRQFREDNPAICNEYPDDRGCSVNPEDITQCKNESLGNAN